MGSCVHTDMSAAAARPFLTLTLALGSVEKISRSSPIWAGPMFSPFLSTTRSLRGRLTFSARVAPSSSGFSSRRRDHGDIGTHSLVPQSSSLTVTSWHTSTSRRVR